MDKKPVIDLKKHQLRKFSRWQLAKIIFYTLVIIGVIAFLIYSKNNPKKMPVVEIDTLEIEL